MAKLLDLLEAQLAIYREGGIPDFDLMREMMDYTTSYPDRYHHPKEDPIFEKIREKGVAGTDLANDLLEEHRKGEERSKRFADPLGNLALEAEIPRRRFEELAREYLAFNRAHMEKEEETFLPLAEKLLSDEDWAEIDARLAASEDPLFGEKVEEAHPRALRKPPGPRFPAPGPLTGGPEPTRADLPSLAAQAMLAARFQPSVDFHG